MKKAVLKLKPVELWEIENLHDADTYIVHNYSDSSRKEIKNFRIAKELALGKTGRILVYAINKAAEESGKLSRSILLTPKILELYEDWKNNFK